MYEINRKHGLYWGLTAATALVCTFLCHAEDASTDTSSPMRQMRSAAKQENEPNVLTGWADAMQNRQIRQIRFIRMQHAGTDWDAGMNDDTRADINLLEQLGTLTGLKVAQRGEAHAIRELARYPRGREPPFVYRKAENNCLKPSAARRRAGLGTRWQKELWNEKAKHLAVFRIVDNDYGLCWQDMDDSLY